MNNNPYNHSPNFSSPFKSFLISRIFSEIRSALVLTFGFVLLLSIIYPVLVWGIAQTFFPFQANGSFINKENSVIGSNLIGQKFTQPSYFHPRPSSAGDGYDAMYSGGSNFGPTSNLFYQTILKRTQEYRKENLLPPTTPIPPDAVTASASGLDPNISIENAKIQAARIAISRGIDKNTILQLIHRFTENRQLGIFGEKQVNVLRLNLALDSLSSLNSTRPQSKNQNSVKNVKNDRKNH